MAIMSDLLNSVETSVAVELSKQAISSLKQYLSRWNVDVSSSQERLETATAEHQREVKSWSEEISFKDLQKPKATSEVFVPLDKAHLCCPGCDDTEDLLRVRNLRSRKGLSVRHGFHRYVREHESAGRNDGAVFSPIYAIARSDPRGHGIGALRQSRRTC
jgi:hypothetical protein